MKGSGMGVTCLAAEGRPALGQRAAQRVQAALRHVQRAQAAHARAAEGVRAARRGADEVGARQLLKTHPAGVRALQNTPPHVSGLRSRCKGWDCFVTLQGRPQPRVGQRCW
jgi:hypothetical protein